MNLSKMNKELPSGSTLSHYCIVSKIGAGGMGEVYLAQDTRLDRRVAIKFLHEEFSKDADKLGRFIQEAKAASALNHPNILTVYEIGEVDGKDYIATELIDGKTLREHLSDKEALQLNAILKIGVQVSEALAAAHQAGIIHRDIKPENIMLRKDGYAKVLDFGLAKLSEPAAVATGSAGSEDATRVQVNTTPGMVMGTVSYMSPEQARGKVTDARTDIWSLGVVLYEMLAGKVPFTGETINHTIVSILEREPLLLANVPAELQRIVRKSMTKDVDMRYQTAHDLLIDLKNLRRDLDIQGELERSVVPNRQTANTSLENATQLYASDAVEATKSGQAAATHSVTTSSSSLEYAVTQAKSHKLVSAIVGIVLLVIVATIVYFAFVSKGRTRQINSIAVMPFVNESGNVDLEYLSDGMTETLINSLSQISNLSVKARSSVFRYKGKELDLKQIASELNVQAILTGRVIQRGDQLTLSLELVDASTENVLWSQQYNRKQSDLVTLQSEIARDVSSKLKSKLSGADVAKVEKTYTTNPEAYQLYLKGKFFWNKRTGESLKQASELYRQAIEKDPNYALAYSGLAETYVLFSSYDVAPANDSMPQAKAAALRALEIDDSLAEAHTALGFYLSNYEWDRDGSEKEYRRAIEVKPNYATAHHWLGSDLSNVKRFDDGLVELRRAEELDPLSPIIGTNLGDALAFARRYDEAIAQYKRTLVRDPNFAYAHRALGWAYGSNGMYPEAIAETRMAIELRTGSSAKGYWGLWLAKSGKRDEAAKLLSELKQEATRDYVQSYTFALIYIGLGDKAEALNWLEKQMSDRSETANTYAVAPELDDLRSEPRFKEMLKRMNLPD
jgi:serine/threonine protein kinase/Tfp pilus assembly protein PilF